MILGDYMEDRWFFHKACNLCGGRGGGWINKTLVFSGKCCLFSMSNLHSVLFCYVFSFFHLKYFLQKENWQERRRSHPLIKCALSYCSLSMNVDKQQIWPLTTDATICPCDIYIYITFHSLELISQKLMWRELWPERSCEMSGRIIFRHGVD